MDIPDITKNGTVNTIQKLFCNLAVGQDIKRTRIRKILYKYSM